MKTFSKISVSLVLMLAVLMVSCSGEADPADQETEDALVITWLVEQGTAFTDTSYLNKLLAEKGLPYKLEIITAESEDYVDYVREMKAQEEPVDIIFSGYSFIAQAKTNYDIFIEEDIYMSLDSYLGDQAQLKGSYSDKVWEALKRSGETYGISINYVVPWQPVVIYNTDIAAQYDIDMDIFAQPVWEWEETLAAVQQQESDDFYVLDFSCVSFEYYLYHYTECLSSHTGIVVDEEADKLQAVNVFETQEFHDIYDTLVKYSEAGYIGDGLRGEESGEYRYMISQGDITTDSYVANIFLEDEAYVPVGEAYVTNDLTNLSNGIASWSSHPEEAFELLAAVMSDEELSTAFIWGREGIDYKVTGGQAHALEAPSVHLNPQREFGNMLLTYPDIYQPADFQQEYTALIEETQNSKVFGFYADINGFEEEVEQLSQLYWDICYGDDLDLYEIGLETFIERQKEAGADQVLDEINRQLKEWAGDE